MSRIVIVLDFQDWLEIFEENCGNGIGEIALKKMKGSAKTFFEWREVYKGLSCLIKMGRQSDFVNKESLQESLREMEALADDSLLNWLDVFIFSSKHGYGEIKHSAMVNICQVVGMEVIENSRNGDFLTSILRDLAGRVKFFSLEEKITFLPFFERIEKIVGEKGMGKNLASFPEGKFPSQFIEEDILSLKKS